MKNWKNYTIKDWCKQVASMFCMILLCQSAFKAFLNEHYVHMVMKLIGALGWLIIYYNLVKNIDKRNTQE